MNLPDKFNKINSITEKKELKKTNKIDRIKVSFDLFVKVGKKVSEIARELNYSNATIESYLVEAYKMGYHYPEVKLRELGLSPDNIENVTKIINKYKLDNEINPPLKYLKENLDKKVSYLTIKLILVKLNN